MYPSGGKEEPMKRTLTFVVVLLIGALSLLVITACDSAESESNPFGFTIPAEVQTEEELLEFLLEQQGEGPWIVSNSEVSIVAGCVMHQQPDCSIYVQVEAVETAEEYNSIRQEWANNFRTLLDPLGLDICKLDIGWGVPSSFEPLGLDEQEASRTPGC
jgi:hypothetical protein